MSDIKTIEVDYSKCPVEGCTATFGKPGIGPTNIREAEEKGWHLFHSHRWFVVAQLRAAGHFAEATKHSVW